MAEQSYVSYEVFVQYNQLEHHQHVGSLLATTPELALQLARENFLRRDRAVNIWVVKSEDIFASPYEEVDYLANELDKSYRRVDGYADNARKWKAFRQRSLEIEDLVKD